MKTAVKLLGALAIIAGMGMVADGLYAACNGEGHLGYPIFQCGDRAYFGPPPAGSGPVTGAFWEIGFGNRTLASGGASTGTGFVASPGFIGNDSGTLITGYGGMDLEDAGFIGGPPGSMCFSSAANWITNSTTGTGSVDGCADNARDGATGTPYLYSRDDNQLNRAFSGNPLSATPCAYGTTNFYYDDNPMAALLTEANNKSFALAFVSATPKLVCDNQQPGDFNFGRVSTGDANPNAPGKFNIVPWQPIPKPNVSATFQTPGDPNSLRILAISWAPVRVVDDGSVLPSSDPTLSNDTARGGVNGVGVRDQGKLIHYAIETAPILDATGACGTFNVAPGSSTDNTNTSTTVPKDTCVRLMTSFGRVPLTTASSAINARQGKMGDIGYLVRSGTVLVGGTLLSNQLVLDSATKKGNDVVVAFHSGSELNTPTYTLHGIANNGKDSVLGTVPCSACSSGLGGTYSLTGSIKGGIKSVYILSSTGEKSNVVDLK